MNENNEIDVVKFVKGFAFASFSIMVGWLVLSVFLAVTNDQWYAAGNYAPYTAVFVVVWFLVLWFANPFAKPTEGDVTQASLHKKTDRHLEDDPYGL